MVLCAIHTLWHSMINGAENMHSELFTNLSRKVWSILPVFLRSSALILRHIYGFRIARATIIASNVSKAFKLSRRILVYKGCGKSYP